MKYMAQPSEVDMAAAAADIIGRLAYGLCKTSTPYQIGVEKSFMGLLERTSETTIRSNLERMASIMTTSTDPDATLYMFSLLAAHGTDLESIYKETVMLPGPIPHNYLSEKQQIKDLRKFAAAYDSAVRMIQTCNASLTPDRIWTGNAYSPTIFPGKL
ncbi:MAG: hypothetical protein HGA85_08885 [Nanoarchaeota archaeon]|nr:hypothetical protein [Nanoarchaeota archaeon]